jgi:hypothetical protein
VEANVQDLRSQFVDYLNKLMLLDHSAMQNIISTRVYTNEALHAGIGVPIAVLDRGPDGDRPLLGALSLINGFLGKDDEGRIIAAKFMDGRLVEFGLTGAEGMDQRVRLLGPPDQPAQEPEWVSKADGNNAE